ncbi:SnoaL-like domain protein [anaerobic digester metagenome]
MDPECIGINRTLDSYTVLYAHRDLAGVVSLVELDFHGFGTGPDEVVSNADEFRRSVERDFAQTRSATISFSDRRCTVEGTAAWVMGTCRFEFDTGTLEGLMEGRFTAVLRRNEKVWRLAQLHLSMPCEDQSEGASWPSE